MPIRELFADRIEQECIACGDVHDVLFTAFTVGVKRETQINAKLMQLPACPVCGAVEFLATSPDDDPDHPSPGSFGHKHKLLVDKLNGQMVRDGRYLSGLDPATLLNKEPSDATLQQWFPGGRQLRRPLKDDHPGGGQ